MDRKLAQVAPKDTDVANKLLGMSIGEGGESSLSVVEVAAKVTKEKPSVPAPRRRKKKNAQTADQNGGQNGGLKPPPVDMSASFSSEEAREGDRSPFADDNETI